MAPPTFTVPVAPDPVHVIPGYAGGLPLPERRHRYPAGDQVSKLSDRHDG
ncbi:MULTISPECIES: hypothetical protein [unclassified Micromonospora]|nr:MULTISPECIES: hypothetical protein [unclassified Micromonospora]MBQ1044119.1 hypothetical protein [Micromonospora sp. C72]MBQ1058291.1 hypothetical protein [Micromonospora sp. C32]